MGENKEIKEIVVDDENLFFPKHSALIEVENVKYTAAQRKSINALLYVAREKLKNNPITNKFEIEASQILEMINLGKKNHFYLDSILSGLIDIKVKYNLTNKDKTKWGRFAMLSGYDYEDGVITFSFPHQIQDALIDPKIYAWIDMKVIKGLKGKYTIPLYELIQDYKKVEKIKMSIDIYKKIVGISDDVYKNNFSMFRRKVIDAPVDEINSNDKIDFKLTYKLKKENKKYSMIIFYVHPKKMNTENNQIEKLQDDEKIDLKKELKSILNQIPYEFQNECENIVKKFLLLKNSDYIQAQIEYCNNQKDVSNYIGLLIDAIKKDYAKWEQKKKEEELRKQKMLEEQKRQEKEKEKVLNSTYEPLKLLNKIKGKTIKIDDKIIKVDNNGFTGNNGVKFADILNAYKNNKLKILDE